MESSSQKMFKLLGTPVGIIEKEDRISQLPDDLLHYILSFVEIIDVVGLSVLSKRWKNLWTTMPFLDFDIQRLWEGRLQDSPLDIEMFRNFINWVLIYQGSSSLARFRLCSGAVFDYEQLLRWIRIAARRNVQQLEIKCDPSQAFELPRSLLISQCLSVLRLNLSGCALRLPSNQNFRHLKSLELERVNLADELLIPSLVSGCGVLEKLSLINCMLHWQALSIASVSLKYLTIKFSPQNEDDGAKFFGSKLEVSCPNLFSFSYIAPKPNRFTLGDLSSLEIMCLDLDMYAKYGNHWDHEVIECEVFKILKAIVNIRSMWLRTDVMLSLVGKVDRVKCFSTTFQRLKSLAVSIWIDGRCTQLMFSLLKNCPSLELLTIILVEFDNYDHYWEWQLDDEGSNWWKYHLKSVQLVNFVDDLDDISFVKFVLISGLVLEKFNIVWMDGHTRSAAAEKLILRLPKASSVLAVKFVESYVNGSWEMFGDF